MSGQKLISLKDASSISGYTPDYIGQLIRSGKIKGEKIYSQITWMTTEKEIINYKNNKNSENSANSKIFIIREYFNRIKNEIKFLISFLKYIRNILPFIVIFLISMIFLSFFVLDLLFNNIDACKIVEQNCREAALEY